VGSRCTRVCRSRACTLRGRCSVGSLTLDCSVATSSSCTITCKGHHGAPLHQVEPVPAVVKGASQLVQLDCIGLLVYVPAAQAVHCTRLPPGEYDPEGQGSQKLPVKDHPGSHTGQPWQRMQPSVCDPVGHAKQGSVVLLSV
jgi:hypothetical protein